MADASGCPGNSPEARILLAAKKDARPSKRIGGQALQEYGGQASQYDKINALNAIYRLSREP